MRKFIDRVLIRSEEILATPSIMRSKKRLGTVDHPQSKILVRCIEEWLQYSFSYEEHEWLDRIRIQWKSLQRRNEIIRIDDFGAGVPSHSEGIKKNVNVGVVSVQNSRSARWLSLMMKLIRELKPHTVLELGTCLGVSGMYSAAGLTMNRAGTLITVEGAEAYASVAKENFGAMKLDNVTQYIGRFSEVLPEILRKHRPIDFVFIDGHHDGEATVVYFEQLVPFLSHSAWLVFDDISWSQSITQAWKKITRDKRVTFSLDLSIIGICYLER